MKLQHLVTPALMALALFACDLGSPVKIVNYWLATACNQKR